MELEQPMLDLEQPVLDLEQLMLREAVCAQKVSQYRSEPSISQPSDDHCHRSESSGTLEMGVPLNYSAEEKLSWLRSQIIGGDAEIDSPSGKRRLTYADHTASGRSLRYIENFITDNVLPFYGTRTITFIVEFVVQRVVEGYYYFLDGRVTLHQTEKIIYNEVGTLLLYSCLT
jgi:hypothetical protein